MIAAVVLAVGCPVATAALCQPHWASITAPTSNPGDVIHVNGPNDVWLAGYSYGSNGLSARVSQWDGLAWTSTDVGRFETAEYGTVEFEPYAIAGTSKTDMWLGGAFWVWGAMLQGIVHWDGTQWTPASIGDIGRVLDIKAVDGNHAWAAGHEGEGRIAEPATPWMAAWDGTTWAVGTPPLPAEPADNEFPSKYSALSAVDATSSTDVWTVGRTRFGQLIVDHFDGSVWSGVAPPTELGRLSDVESISPTDVWVTGSLLAHWDGTRWTTPSVPELPARLAAASSRDVWGVGAGRTLRYDGRSWKIFDTPSVTDSSFLAAVPDGDVWAAGPTARICPSAIGDATLTPAAVTLTQGLPVAWHFLTANSSPHSLVDGTGLGLVDSGARQPGSGYQATFKAAGRYSVLDQTSGLRQTVSVLLKATPTAGSTSTTFTIRWLSGTVGSDIRFDVQLKRPGAADWASWLTESTAPTATFSPDAGAGAYAFRSRMRNASTGAASNWSIPKVVTAG